MRNRRIFNKGGRSANKFRKSKSASLRTQFFLRFVIPDGAFDTEKGPQVVRIFAKFREKINYEIVRIRD